MQMNPNECFIGIDVSKAQLDVSVLPQETFWSCPNDEAGRADVVARLRELAPTLIVLEATGGYEAVLAAQLAAAGLPVVVNPRQVRAFAQACGKLAKTDRIEARVLALYAKAMRPQVRPLKDEQSRELDALFIRRHQLVDMLMMEKNRLSLPAKRVRKNLQAHITWLEKRVNEVDGELRGLIEASPVWRAKDEILQSAKGIGPVASMALLSQLPELGWIGKRSVPWPASPR